MVFRLRWSLGWAIGGWFEFVAFLEVFNEKNYEGKMWLWLLFFLMVVCWDVRGFLLMVHFFFGLVVAFSEFTGITVNVSLCLCPSDLWQ